MPQGVREGQIVEISIEFDEDATEDARQRAQWLLGELQRKSKRK